MPIPDQAAMVKELEAVLVPCRATAAASPNVAHSDALAAITRALAAVERFAPPGSAYVQIARDSARSDKNAHVRLHGTVGALEALVADAKRGGLETVVELVHGETFADFLDRAKYLLDENHKDAAAVIAGSTLEVHLRALCTRHGIDTDDAKARPKKAELLNAELCKAGAYLMGDQKQVTAWLDLRNDAAHGHYTKYGDEQVNLMIAGIRDFMRRVPA